MHGGENVGSILGSVYFFDDKSGILSTTFDLFRTNDGGTTLERLDELPEMTFDSIYFDTQGFGWIVGGTSQSPKILRSADMGRTWATVPLETDGSEELDTSRFSRFFDICIGANGLGWIAGDKGVVGIFFENDRLIASKSFYFPHSIFSITCTGAKSFAAGQNGTILSYNGEWKEERLGADVTFTRIRVIEDQIWVVGGNSTKGVVFSRSETDGKWLDRSPRTSSIVFDITPTNQQILLAGANGLLLGSSNLGDSWESLDIRPQGDLSRIFCSDSNCWVIGDRLSIFRSEFYRK